MTGTEIQADLLLENGGQRYVVSSEGDRLVVRAGLRDLVSLRTETGGVEAHRALFRRLSGILGGLNLSLQWRWGPLRLTLIRPGGPTRIARLLGLGGW